MVYVPRLKKEYRDTIASALKEEFSLKNPMMVPTIDKIVVNMGVGEAINDKKHLANAIAELEKITGQKPVTTYAKKSIASFKLREGMAVGCKVTLREDRMWEFLDRLINIALPRVRDFRGLSSKSFDGQGNYAFGIKEQIVFPEINYDDVDRTRGMDVVISIKGGSRDISLSLLKKLNLPILEKGV